MPSLSIRSIYRAFVFSWVGIPTLGLILTQISLAKEFNPNILQDWGLYNSKYPSHIRAPEAWKLEEGSNRVIVAVIDTGISPNDPALSSNLWKHRTSKRTSIYGWDFVENKPNPIDVHGHGTHIAGIIGATLDAVTGTSGVTHEVSIMALRYYSDQNSEATNLRNSIAAMHYAIDNGAQIINYSGGGPSFSEEEYKALQKAERKGVLLVAAAGNEHSDTDIESNAFYPACYPLTNIISVTATDIQNRIVASSNWGKKKVNVAAPGERIISTIPGLQKGAMTGTSQATAFVSGIAALLLSKNPRLTPAQTKQFIESNVDFLQSLQEKVKSSGRVDAYRSVLAVSKSVR
jgi:thermitase